MRLLLHLKLRARMVPENFITIFILTTKEEYDIFCLKHDAFFWIITRVTVHYFAGGAMK